MKKFLNHFQMNCKINKDKQKINENLSLDENKSQEIIAMDFLLLTPTVEKKGGCDPLALRFGKTLLNMNSMYFRKSF